METTTATNQSATEAAPNSSGDQKPFDIAIVGGGIAGLVLAIALVRKRVPIALYESSPRFGEIGAGVSFGPNATRAMEMIDPSIRRGFDRCATHNGEAERREVYFDFLLGDERLAEQPYRLDDNSSDGPTARAVGDHIYTLHCEGGQASVHRAHFLEEMIALLPPTVARLGKKLVDFRQLSPSTDDSDPTTTSSSGVELTFADGSTARHSALVGCDGIKSTTRALLLGASHPAAHAVFSGKVAYRGLVPMPAAATSLGHPLASNAHMHLGRGGHLLTFAIEHGATMNVVAFASRASWPSSSAGWTAPATPADARRDFAGWGDRVHSILRLVSRSDVWALFDHPPCEAYARGRVCLAGDAAHASTPHQGAGAGMAVEDALVLAELVGAAGGEAELEAALGAYDAVRRPRTQQVVETSREAGVLYDLEMEGVGEDLARVREQLARRFKWIWEVDLDAEVGRAKAEMEKRLAGGKGRGISTE